MDKIIKIGGRDMTLRANALLPRKYRYAFGRDLITDMRELVDAHNNNTELNYELFENLTWLMLREGGNDVGKTPDDWLVTIDDMFEVYNVLPDVIELWSKNQITTAKPKKK